MREIVQDGAPVLRAVAKAVPKEMLGTNELHEMIADMTNALDAERDGVALAAPQVGISYRIFVVRFDRMLGPAPEGITYPADVGVFINPDFVKTSRKRDVMDEGCLSVRGKYGKTYRFERATVRAQDETGRVFERGGGGIIAQAYQHEIDHLNGILFIDHAEDIHEYDRKPNA